MPPPSTRRARDKAILYLQVGDEQLRALRVHAFMRGRTLADIVREAIDDYLAAKGPTAADIEDFIELVRKSVRAMPKPSRG